MSRTIEKDELIYRGRVLEVHKLTMRMKDGGLIDRDLVHYRGAAVILPILADGRIVLIRNYRYTVDQTLYELPAGMLDADEDPQAGAIREMAEETGYTGGEVSRLGQLIPAPGTSDEVIHAFVALHPQPGPQALERYEEISVAAFTAEQVKAMMASGEICDAKTIATLALYWIRETNAPRQL